MVFLAVSVRPNVSLIVLEFVRLSLFNWIVFLRISPRRSVGAFGRSLAVEIGMHFVTQVRRIGGR